MPVDPADQRAVGAVLLPYLQSRLGPGVEYAHPPEALGRGFDTFIYAFRIRGESLDAPWRQPLVLRVYPTESQADKARREATIQDFVVNHGYPALAPLALEPGDPALGLPFMIMRRVEGGALLEAITKAPWRAKSLLGRMADLHARLHTLPIEGCALPYDLPLVDAQLADVRARIDELHAAHMEEGYGWLVDRKALVAQEEPVLCHNDFHPLNILLEPGGAMTVIDWSNAARGDRHCDVARTVALIWFAQVAASSPVERLLLRVARGFLRNSYFSRYNEILPVDPRRLAYWEALHTFWGWSQLEDVAARASRGEQQAGMARQIPPGTLDVARNRFWQLAKSFA
jgi:aminoglycoside phosphotransferase (APT) family kinase protein